MGVDKIIISKVDSIQEKLIADSSNHPRRKSIHLPKSLCYFSLAGSTGETILETTLKSNHTIHYPGVKSEPALHALISKKMDTIPNTTFAMYAAKRGLFTELHSDPDLLSPNARKPCLPNNIWLFAF